MNRTLSIAEWFGLAAFAAAIGLGAIAPVLATVPLTLFILACLAAPFVPWLGFFLPVVSRGNRAMPFVALTFDDGPDPQATPAVLALLGKYDLRATFFVTGRKAERHPQLVRAILKAGHTIGSHAYGHSPFTPLRGPRAVSEEIRMSRAVLEKLGAVPLAYRPPVGINTPGLGQVLDRLGMYAVNFRCRSFDRGNRRLHNLAPKTLARVRPGDILVLHDLAPAGGRTVAHWLKEVEKIIAGLERRRLAVVPLETLIGRPVMKRTGVA